MPLSFFWHRYFFYLYSFPFCKLASIEGLTHIFGRDLKIYNKIFNSELVHSTRESIDKGEFFCPCNVTTRYLLSGLPFINKGILGDNKTYYRHIPLEWDQQLHLNHKKINIVYFNLWTAPALNIQKNISDRQELNRNTFNSWMLFPCPDYHDSFAYICHIGTKLGLNVLY